MNQMSQAVYVVGDDALILEVSSIVRSRVRGSNFKPADVITES
jgi:hypothetical protein